MKVSGLWVLLLLFVFGTTFLSLNVSGRRIVSLVPGKYFPFCYFGFCLRNVCLFWCSFFLVTICYYLFRNMEMLMRLSEKSLCSFMIWLVGVQNCLLIVVVLFLCSAIVFSQSIISFEVAIMRRKQRHCYCSSQLLNSFKYRGRGGFELGGLRLKHQEVSVELNQLKALGSNA